MKFRCQAVDHRGRVVTEVLRAESEADARGMLLDEDLFLKRIEEVSEEEKVTWTSRKRVQAAHDAHRRAGSAVHSKPAFVRQATTSLLKSGSEIPGVIGITAEGEVIFSSSDGRELFSCRAGDVEAARFSGFPSRQLELFLISGESVQFAAGFLKAHPVMKAIAGTLAPVARKK